jgi:hypothetical protein
MTTTTEGESLTIPRKKSTALSYTAAKGDAKEETPLSLSPKRKKKTSRGGSKKRREREITAREEEGEQNEERTRTRGV